MVANPGKAKVCALQQGMEEQIAPSDFFLHDMLHGFNL